LHIRYTHVTLVPGTEGTRGRRSAVPFIDVKLYDRRVTDESVPKMIEALTKALAETSGADPADIHVVIQGVEPKHWGIAGKPGA
jgi:4-oxalocrotonate tautomerase